MAIALDTLAYARRLREAGFSESQAEGQAEALAAAMTDTLATKQDLSVIHARFSEFDARMNAGFAAAKQDVRELEIRMDSKFAQMDIRLAEFEKRVDARFDHLERHLDTRLDGKLADLERRVTVRMLAGIAAVSALVKLL
jgi:hypothetical protein